MIILNYFSRKELITANLNDYIDFILPALRDFLKENGFEPMPIPDLTEAFSAVIQNN